MNVQIQNFVTGEAVKHNTSRANRVKTMKRKYHSAQVVEPSLMNKFHNLFSTKKPLPVGTFKRTKGGAKLRNYQLRALNELSSRSLKTIESNLKLLNNKKNKSVLRKALNITKRNRKNNRA